MRKDYKSLSFNFLIMDEQQLQQQIVQLVQAALQGNQEANQQIEQIMQAAQQGNQEAVQIAQMIQQVAQQMQQQQVRAAKFGAKLNYIRQLKGQCPEGYKMEYFKQGGQLCKRCMKMQQDGGEVKPAGTVAEQFKMESAKCGKKMKKAEKGTKTSKWTNTDMGYESIKTNKQGKMSHMVSENGTTYARGFNGVQYNSKDNPEKVDSVRRADGHGYAPNEKKPKLVKKSCGGPMKKKACGGKTTSKKRLINKGENGLIVNPYEELNRRAAEANQSEARLANAYFLLSPSIPNLVKGVYHWMKSKPWLLGENENSELITGDAPGVSFSGIPQGFKLADTWKTIRDAGKWGKLPKFKPGYRGTKEYVGGYGSQQGNLFLSNNAKIGGGPSNAADIEKLIFDNLLRDIDANRYYSEYQVQKAISQRLNNLYRLSDDDLQAIRTFSNGNEKLYNERLMQLIKGHSGRVRQGTR